MYLRTYFGYLYGKISCNNLNKNHSIKYYNILKDKIRHAFEKKQLISTIVGFDQINTSYMRLDIFDKTKVQPSKS